MVKAQILSCCRRTGLTVFTGLTLCIQSPLVAAQSLMDGQTTETVVMRQGQPLPLEQRPQITYDSYILGPGDGLQIELLDLPELSGGFSIGPDGTLYLPRLRALYVEGLTIEELRTLLTQKFSTYVRDPQVYLRPVVYRPIRVYVGGEVKRPGYYTLTGVQSAIGDNNSSLPNQLESLDSQSAGLQNNSSGGSIASGSSSATLFPTVFDAIRSARNYSLYGPFPSASDPQTRRRPWRAD